MIKYWQVGGCVRDEFLGVKSKDIDYAVEAPDFETMSADIEARGGEIFLSKPEYQTVRARVPDLGIADYVLCRKESFYTDGRRPDSVTIGTIDDDLARRDFTMNAMAKDEDGNIYDPYLGRKDLKMNIIRCVGNAHDRFSEDSLRMLRAIRFKITKNMQFHYEIEEALHNHVLTDKLKNVSRERVREELYRCFAHNAMAAFNALQDYPSISYEIFCMGINFKPTLETL